MAGTKRKFMDRYKAAKKKGKPRVYQKSKKARTGSFAAQVKKVILQTAEAKQHRYDMGKTELYHNSGSPASGQILHTQIWLDGPLPPQGVGDSARVGDEIVCSSIAVKMLIGMKAARHNVTFRFIVFKCTSAAYPSTLAQLLIGISNNILLEDTNKDRVQIVRDYKKKIQIHPDLSGVGGADKEYTFAHQMRLPYQQKIKFETDGSVVSSNKKNLYVQIMAYDAYGSLLTDNIAYFAMTTTLYYKDP